MATGEARTQKRLLVINVILISALFLAVKNQFDVRIVPKTSDTQSKSQPLTSDGVTKKHQPPASNRATKEHQPLALDGTTKKHQLREPNGATEEHPLSSNGATKEHHCKVHDFNSYVNTTDLDQYECIASSLVDVQICVYPDDMDSAVSKVIRNSGGFEIDKTKIMLETLEKYPNAAFLDIGANLGAHSLVMAKYGRKVLAVEPQKSVIEILHKSVVLNKLTDRYTLVENGLSNKRGKVSFYIHPKCRGCSSLINKNGHMPKETIEIVLMDDLLEVFHEKEAIMKIDIEGSESRAFMNSTKLFSAVQIHAIFMEWNQMRRRIRGEKKDPTIDPSVENKYANDMIEYLRSLGYVPFADMNSPDSVLYDKDKMDGWPRNIIWIKQWPDIYLDLFQSKNALI